LVQGTVDWLSLGGDDGHTFRGYAHEPALKAQHLRENQSQSISATLLKLRRLTFSQANISLQSQKMYFRANWTMRGFTLVEVICPKLPAAKFGRA
jgi:hypothetical protein